MGKLSRDIRFHQNFYYNYNLLQTLQYRVYHNIVIPHRFAVAN